MYVHDSARGRALPTPFSRVSKRVRSAGLSVLRLETGTRQVAAMRLYIRTGFRECPAFGDYALKPPESIAASVFFEKWIGA